MKRLAGTAALCAGVLGATAAIALGAPAAIVGQGDDTFSLPSYNHDAGTVAQFSVTGSTHNVTASAKGPDGKALFRSPTISGGSTPVDGTQYLAAGTYPFVCTIHPGMTSSLMVSGTPQPRPTVALKVLDKKLAKVVKGARLRVKLTATGSGNVPVDALLGKKAIATRTQVDAPGSTVLKLPLTKKGLKALAKKKAAKVTVESSIDFGSPVKVSATLK